MQNRHSICNGVLLAILTVGWTAAPVRSEEGKDTAAPSGIGLISSTAILECGEEANDATAPAGIGLLSSSPVLECCPEQILKERDRPYWFRFRAGMDYYTVPIDTHLGGFYSATAVMQIYQQWCALGDFSVNHISGGSQFLGTVGLIHLPNFWSEHIWQRYTVAILFDQYSDTRIANQYLSQIRTRLGFAPNPDLEVGVGWTEPTNHGNGKLFVDPTFQATTFGSVQQAHAISAFYAVRLLGVRAGGEVGYRTDPDSMLVSGNALVPLMDHVNLFGNATYITRTGSWGSSVGLEYHF